MTQALSQKIKIKTARGTCQERGLSILEILIAVAIISFVFIPAVQVMYSVQPKNMQDIISGAVGAGPSDFHERGDLLVAYGKGGTWRSSSIAHRNFSRQSCIDFNPDPHGSHASSTPPSPYLFLYAKGELGVSTTTSLTGIALVGQKLYVGANSPSTTEPDVLVYNVAANMNGATILEEMEISGSDGAYAKPPLSLAESKNTGPGVSSIQSRGMHIFEANTGVKSQVDRLDADLSAQVPYVIPGSNSATNPLAKVALHAGSMLVVGTEKSVLPEITFFDTDSGHALHSIETGYGINDMVISDGMLIVAGPRDPEIEVFDVRPGAEAGGFGQKIGEYDLPGGSGNAKALSLFGSVLSVGRTKGGNEFVLLDLVKNSAGHASDGGDAAFRVSFREIWNAKIGWSVDAVLNFEKYIILFAADEYREFQMYERRAVIAGSDSATLRSSLDLPARVSSSLCFKNTIWATLRDPVGGAGTGTPALALIVF